ncbi:hypothetical protein EV424DRAFT_60357 [Suillus variegatus]|nr:hypothetical protein EV424DRAFT_60357 [Suillus variegatus]
MAPARMRVDTLTFCEWWVTAWISMAPARTRTDALTFCEWWVTAWISMAPARTRTDALTFCEWWVTAWISMAPARTRTDTLTHCKRWATTWIEMALARTRSDTLTHCKRWATTWIRMAPARMGNPDASEPLRRVVGAGDSGHRVRQARNRHRDPRCVVLARGTPTAPYTRGFGTYGYAIASLRDQDNVSPLLIKITYSNSLVPQSPVRSCKFIISPLSDSAGLQQESFATILKGTDI